MSDGQSTVETCPPAGSLVWVIGILTLDQVHESWLMEEWEHAVEIFEEILEQRHCFGFGWQRSEDGSLEKVPEYLRLPISPFVVVFRDFGNHILEGVVAGLMIDPLDALW